MQNQSTTLRKITSYSLLLIVAYVITGRLGLMLALPPGYASAIFPPAGIAIAAVFIGGKRALPAIFIGSLLLNAWVGYDANHQIDLTSIEVALFIALASAIQAWIGGWWLKRKIGYPTSLDSPNDVVTFFVSAPFICLISATLSVSGLYAIGLIEKSIFFTSLASWWIGDSLGLLIMLPLTLVSIGRPRNIWKQRLTTVALPMMVTFALLVIIFVIVSRWERKESLIEFDALSNQVSEQLRIRFESQEAVQEQISALFSYRNYDTVSTQDFHNFVKKTMSSYPMIYAIEWAPNISQKNRNSFIKQQQQDYSIFDIKQFDANKKLVTASVRNDYYPITYIEPLNDSTRAILGFDLTSLPDRKAIILEAINKKKTISSSPTELIVHQKNELGLVLMYPIQGTSQDGILSTVLKANTFFGEIFNPTKNTLEVRLIDAKSKRALYDGFSGNQTEVLYTRSFEFSGRQYLLESAPTAFYYQKHRGWQSWNMLAIGIFGTGLMGVLLLMGTGYTARIENMVKQKADELQESFSRFQEITSTLGEGIYVMDTHGMITFTNPQAQHLLGLSENELLGQNAHLLFHSKHINNSPYPESDCKIRNVVLSGQPYKSTEEVFWHKDGSPIYISVNAVPLFRDNNIVGAVIVFDDISERKKIEHALRASEKSFKEIIEYAPIGMAIVSLQGTFTIVNQTLCNIVGYTNEELLKLTFQEITHPEDLSIDLEHVNQLLAGEANAYQLEKRYIRKNKEIVWVQLSVNIFRDEDKTAQYFIAQIEDITERKIRDNEILQHAYIDALTKLPNRRMLLDRLHQELSQAERHKRNMALFFLDLDHFKQINDSLGHDVGDLVLKEAASRLLSCVRAHDTVSRLGGDEFVIILSEITNPNETQLIAEKILGKFKMPFKINGQELLMGTSIGIALRTGDMKISPKELIKHADIAMYESKAAGRNRYYFYDAI